MNDYLPISRRAYGLVRISMTESAKQLVKVLLKKEKKKEILIWVKPFLPAAETCRLNISFQLTVRGTHPTLQCH
jgi:hypothetical protein